MIPVLDDPRPTRVEPVPAHVVTAAAASVVLGLFLALVGLRLGVPAVLALAVVGLVVPVAWGRPDLALLGMVLALPLGAMTLGPVDVVQVTVGGASLIVLLRAASRVAIEPPAWQVGVPLVAFALLAALATTRTRDPDLAFNLDVQLGLLVLLVFALVTGLSSVASVHRTTLALVAAGGVIALVALVDSGPTTTYYAGGIVEGRAQGIFGQPNELGVVAAALLVLAVGVGLTVTTRRARLLCLVSGVLLLGALGLSLSRGAWLGAIVGLGVLAVLSPPARRPLLKAAGATTAGLVVLLLAGTGFSSLLVERLSSLGEATSNPYDQRTEIWAEAVRQIGLSPVIGSGPGGFTLAAQEQSLRSGVALDAEHAHNLYLNTAVEFGVLGLLALVALMVGLVFCAVRARSALLRGGAGPVAELPAALAAALAAVAVHGLLDYPMRNAVCITTVFLLVGLLVAARRRSVRRTVVAAGDFRPLPEPSAEPRAGLRRRPHLAPRQENPT